MKKNIQFLTLGFIVLVFSSPSYSAKWYEGGSLQKATVQEWTQATYKNKLATAGDWFMNITKAYKPSLKIKLDNLATSQYHVALKKFAEQLEICTSDTISIKSSNGRAFSSPNDKAAEIASMCYLYMYGTK